MTYSRAVVAALGPSNDPGAAGPRPKRARCRMQPPRSAPNGRAACPDAWAGCRVENAASHDLATSGRRGGPTQETPAAAGTKVEPPRACQVRRGSGERHGSHRRGGTGGLEPWRAGAGSWGGVRRACCAACEHADQQQLRGAASRRRQAARDAAQDAQPIGDDSAANERSTGVEDRREDVAAAPSLSSSSAASVERRDGTHHWCRAVRGRLASRDSSSQSAGPGGRTARRSGGRRGHHHGCQRPPCKVPPTTLIKSYVPWYNRLGIQVPKKTTGVVKLSTDFG